MLGIDGVFSMPVYDQVISLAGWVNIMYYVQDSHSFWDWIYFVSLIVVSYVVCCRLMWHKMMHAKY